MQGQRHYIGLKKKEIDMLRRGKFEVPVFSSMDPTHVKPVQPATAVFSESKETPLSFTEHKFKLK